MELIEKVNIIRQVGFETHVYFKNGFLEKVYENTLMHRLLKRGLIVEQQYPIRVSDEDGFIVGHYVADLFVENSIIIEIKTVKTLEDIHVAQLLAYLKASKIKHGILMNFGGQKFQIKKYIL